MSRRQPSSPESSSHGLLRGRNAIGVSGSSTESSVNQLISAEKQLGKWEKEHHLSTIEQNPNYHFLLNRDKDHGLVPPKQMKYVTEVSPLGHFDTRADTSATLHALHGLHGELQPAPLRSAVTDANNIFPPTLNVQLPHVTDEKVDYSLPDVNMIAASNCKLVDNVMSRSQVLPLRLEVQRLTKTNIALHTHLMESLAKQEHNETHYQQQLKELTQVHNDLKFVHGQQDRRIQELNMSIATMQDKLQQILLAKSPQFEQVFDLTSVLTTGNVNVHSRLGIDPSSSHTQQERVITILKNAQSHINNLTQEVAGQKERTLQDETNLLALTRKNEQQIAEIERLSNLLGNNVNWDKIHVETELEQNARMIEKLQRQVDILNEERVLSMKAIQKLGASAVAAVANAGGYHAYTSRGRSTSRGRGGSRVRDDSNHSNAHEIMEEAKETKLNPKSNLKNKATSSASALERKLQSQVSSLTNEVRVLRQTVHEKDKLKKKLDTLLDERKQQQKNTHGMKQEYENAELALQQLTELYNEEKETFEQDKQYLQEQVKNLRQEQDHVYEVCSEELAAQQNVLVTKYEEEVQTQKAQLDDHTQDTLALAHDHDRQKSEHKQQSNVCVRAMHQIEQLQQAQQSVNEELRKLKLEKRMTASPVSDNMVQNLQMQLELEQSVSKGLQQQLAKVQAKLGSAIIHSSTDSMHEQSLKHQLEYLMNKETERKASTEEQHQEIQRLTEKQVQANMQQQLAGVSNKL